MSMARGLGGDLFIAKPTNFKVLNRMIEDIFKRDWAGVAAAGMAESMLLFHTR